MGGERGSGLEGVWRVGGVRPGPARSGVKSSRVPSGAIRRGFLPPSTPRFCSLPPPYPPARPYPPGPQHAPRLDPAPAPCISRLLHPCNSSSES